MNRQQAMTLLSMVAMIEGRTVDDGQAAMWASTLPDVTMDEATAAATRFFREPEKWLRQGELKRLAPDHVLRIVREERRSLREQRTAIEGRGVRARREPWRHCGNQACKCTHTHCGIGTAGYLDDLEEYVGDGVNGLRGVTYDRLKPCPICRPGQAAKPLDQALWGAPDEVGQ